MAGSTRLRFTLLRIFCTVFTVFVATATAVKGESILLNEITKASNRSLLWGPYRPNLYFGVKPRIPQSFMAGLMWSGVNNFTTFQHSEYQLDMNCCEALTLRQLSGISVSKVMIWLVTAGKSMMSEQEESK
jgi:hypothetical protein